MRISWIALTGLGASLAAGQTVTSVYNRDTHDPFHLKNIKVESTVIGPIVRTDTLLTYDNPYQQLTEATLNFEMPKTGALGGFAYFYGKEYVPGKLMDSNLAWRIYTAITSRNRDPGIMEQWSPTTYHCQIYPIRKGQDLKVRLWTVGLLDSEAGQLTLPKPSAPKSVSFYRTEDQSLVEPEWAVRTVKSSPAIKVGDGYRVAMNGPVEAIGQRFKDGRFYVAGLIRTDTSPIPKVEIQDAEYEPSNGGGKGANVTSAVEQLVAKNVYSIPAENRILGDPNPNIFKRLHIKYRLNGLDEENTIQEHDSMDLLSGYRTSADPKFSGIQGLKTIRLDRETVAFTGWTQRPRTVAASFGEKTIRFRPKIAPRGNDTARIWAQQVLARSGWGHEKALRFSLKFGVPSNATALLAVPKAEMKAYEEREAEARRKALETKRQGRSWSGSKDQNWNASGGGDPEIRVTIPDAKSVEAILPDRRVIELTSDQGVWGGNFEIPAEAPEGEYRVRVVAKMKDGSTQEKSWTYNVDRTPPKGTAEYVSEDGALWLEVHSEAKLAQVTAYAEDGTKYVLVETKPGIYRVSLPMKIHLIVVMKDQAGNKGEVTLLP